MGSVLLVDREDVVFANDDVLVAIDVHVGACVLAEEDSISGVYTGYGDFTAVERLAGAYCHDLALLGLLFGGIGDDDAPTGGLFLIYALDEDSVLKRTDLHVSPFFFRIISGQGPEIIGATDSQRNRVLNSSKSGVQTGQEMT